MHCSRSLGCPPADTLAGDGNAHLKRRETGEGEEGGRIDVIRVKTRRCKKDISHSYGLMEGKVTVVMEERGNPSLQCSFLQQI